MWASVSPRHLLFFFRLIARAAACFRLFDDRAVSWHCRIFLQFSEGVPVRQRFCLRPALFMITILQTLRIMVAVIASGRVLARRGAFRLNFYLFH